MGGDRMWGIVSFQVWRGTFPRNWAAHTPLMPRENRADMASSSSSRSGSGSGSDNGGDSNGSN